MAADASNVETKKKKKKKVGFGGTTGDSKAKKKKKVGFGGGADEQKEDDRETKLLKLLRFSPLRGRHGMQQHLKQYKEQVYNLSSGDDDEASNVQQNIDLNEFLKMFDGKIGKELATEMFSMIHDGSDQTDAASNEDNDDQKKDEADNRKVSQFDIIKFMEGKKVAKHVRAVTIKDADWVLQHLKDVQFADLDKDSDGKIVIQDFFDHFEPLGVSRERITLMFQMLDKNDDKKISIFEYESWRRKQTASDLQNILNVTFSLSFSYAQIVIDCVDD